MPRYDPVGEFQSSCKSSESRRPGLGARDVLKPGEETGDVDDFDFHTWLAAQPGDDRATRSVVIEFTPRVRAQHLTWTLEVLQGLARQKTRVRASGWTMLDPEHPDEVGKSRGTIWEIHPVMQVETQQGGNWKRL